MNLCTKTQMRSIDRRTIEEHGLSGLNLMEKAGFHIFNFAEKLLGSVVEQSIAIFCGKGNNGGDGFVAARYLHEKGARVNCFVLAKKQEVTGEPSQHLEKLEEAGVSPVFLTDTQFSFSEHHPHLIIDALLGTGLRGIPQQIYAHTISKINTCSSPVLSVDIPSGLGPQSGFPESSPMEDWNCVRADHTLAIGLMKIELATYPGRSWTGKVEIADIGFPVEAIEAEQLYLSMPTRDEIANLMPRYLPSDHKGSHGRVLVIAGSIGMAGAASLTCRAALRSGAGMVNLGIPESILNPLMGKHTELILHKLPETSDGSLSLEAEYEITKLLHRADALAIGPGLSQQEETQRLIRRVVANAEVPLVIDADGINAFSKNSDALSQVEAEIILTPHLTELSRLIGTSVKDIKADRINISRQAAKDLRVNLVVKGPSTLVVSPCGKVSVNPTGNPGMATAGSGDVLTGIIAALIGQGLTAWDACILGVYLHGEAGDLGSKVIGQHSLIATDLIAYLPQSFQSIIKS